MNFLSDNAAPIAPAVLEAIVLANDGFAIAYGDDEWTRSVERQLSELFEREVAAFLVPTGTAANALALAHLTPPWGAVLCHADSHIATDECGAPEFFGGGLKLIGLSGQDGKVAAEMLKCALRDDFGHSPHQMIASALSITQATEAGTVYRQDEIAALCEIAHERSLAVHMDGARFANASVQLDATPAQITWQSGVDVLSFGATKAGALTAEAVVFFNPAQRRSWPNTVSERATCCPSIGSWPRNSRPFSRKAGGSPSRALSSEVADPEHALDALLVPRPLRDLLELTIVGEERIISFFVGPIDHGPLICPWSAQMHFLGRFWQAILQLSILILLARPKKFELLTPKFVVW